MKDTTTDRSKRSSPPTGSSSPAIRKEVKYLGLAAFGILLLLSIFAAGSLGFIGQFFRNLLLGLFGLGGVFLPIVLTSYAVLVLVSKKVNIPLWRSLILVWIFLAWLYVIVDPVGDNYYTAFEYLRAVYRTGHLAAGGVVGAILGGLIQSFAARVGAIIILSFAIIGLLVNITNRSFVKLVEGGVDKARHLYDERKARQYEEEDEEEEIIYKKADLQVDVPKRIPPAPVPTPAPAPSGKIMRKKPQEELRPLVMRKPKEQQNGKRAELIDIDPNEQYSDDYTVLLVQEELEEATNAKNNEDIPPKEMPPFLQPKQREAGPKIFASGVEIKDDEPYIQPTAPAKPVPLTPPPQPLPLQEEKLEEILVDYVYEPDATGRIMPDDPNHDDSTEISESTPGPVVRGLVANAAPSVPPLFEYDEDTDLTEYDEYAHITREAKPAPTQQEPTEPNYEDFKLPSLNLLTKNEKSGTSVESRTQVMQNTHILEETLRSFRVEAKVVAVSVGPTVTRYDLAPGPGVKVSSIANLSNDLALSLAAQGIRIEAPIPGKSAVGIEIPNKEPRGVFLREILEHDRFEGFSSKLAFAVGQDIAGDPVVADVADMPHLLIAGATGAGKSVCINTLIASLLYKSRPDEVKLLMIDPKVVELSVYNGIPHLLIPVVTDPKKASGALNWAVQEMESRYNSFAETGCRDLKGYNRYLTEQNSETQPLPQIVIIIDELADLMMTCKGEVEEAICRLAQKARAAGIHLIVATQRPSVDVITGLIKANIPSRLAFAVSSGTDSRTVLDMQGAEKLLGRGDMLFLPRGQNKPIRVQGGFISDKEVENLVAFLKAQAPVTHTTEMIQQVTMPGKANVEGDVDEFFHDAVDFLLVKGKASTSMLQRQFRIGYNRASRLMEDLETRGIVGPEDGVKPRKVTITREEYREIYGDSR